MNDDNSSSSEEEENDTDNHDGVPVKRSHYGQDNRNHVSTTLPTTTTATLPITNDHTTSTTAATISNSTPTSNSTINNTKGKRLLSLASVLPPHILAALTKQQQQQRHRSTTYEDKNDDDDEYTDDDDEYDTELNQTTNDDSLTKTNTNTNNGNLPEQSLPPRNATTGTKRTSTRASSTPTNPHQSNAISSFLKDLHQVGFTNNNNNNKSMDSSILSSNHTAKAMLQSPATITTVHHIHNNNNNSPSQQPSSLSSPTTTTTSSGAVAVSKLGAAFLHTSTTTVTSKHANMVRNIHDTEEATTGTHHNQDDDDDNTDERHTSTVQSNKPNTSNPIPPSRWPRPNRTIRAAPPVLNAVPSSLPPQPVVGPSNQEAEPRFLSRKEIERTLRRSGNIIHNPDTTSISNSSTSISSSNNKMDDVWKNMEFTQTQEGVDPNRYAPNVMAAAQQQQLTSITSNASFIHNSTTQIYDPTLGTTVPYQATKADTTDATAMTKTVAMKGKGKNQINALLAQAVTLERERNEQQMPTTTSKTTQQTHRANAKRKYGW